MTMQLKKGILQGTDVGQWGSALDRYIQGTLGALSRDLGGERGHFTDFDARRIQGLFADLKTGMLALGPMTSSGEAKKLMRQITATISDRVRTSQSLRQDDPLPWDVRGKMRETPRAGGAPSGGAQTAPAATAGAAGAPAPTPPTQGAPVPVAPTPTPTAQEPATAPPATQEPAQGGKPIDGPTAQQHVKQALGELFPGRAPQSLSADEKRQLVERARAIGTAAGFTF
jgi:hypothetical protein